MRILLNVLFAALLWAMIGCASSHKSQTCQDQINHCMEQCATDPQPSERQSDRKGGAKRDALTRCERLCSQCNAPKQKSTSPSPTSDPFGNATFEPSNPLPPNEPPTE